MVFLQNMTWVPPLPRFFKKKNNNEKFLSWKKKFVSWYLITLKVKEILDAGIPNSTGSIELSKQSQQPQTQQPSDELHIQVNGDSESLKKDPKSPESDWIITIREKLDHAQQDDVAGTWGKRCIYKVPRYLSECNNKAYIPNTVSLGPYHHGRRRLRNMERHKRRAFYQILKRTNQDVKLYVDSIKELEENARACYEEQISLSSNEFVEMMVLDGCFVLELFRGAKKGFTQLGYSRCDPVFSNRGSMHSIQRDMIMLENQIPLFILDRLLELQPGQPDQKGSVTELALPFFDPLVPTDEPSMKSDQNRMEPSLRYAIPFDPLHQSPLHCLHVFRQRLLRGFPKTKPHSSGVVKRRTQLIHCVTELKEAGIKFKKRKTDRFWDIKFKNGVLKIPRLLIHDGTKSLFLNLIAFEQSHLDCGNQITSYVIFMDNLINSPEDVGYLHYCGIFEHWLGSDGEVADLFNRLCQEVVFNINDSYLSELSEKVNRSYKHRWNLWRASLMHNYFNNPWAIISFFAAVVLLILTSAQTFYGVYGYYRPP